AGLARREGENMTLGAKPQSAPVDVEDGATRNRAREACCVAILSLGTHGRGRLEGRNLRQVQHVEDVDTVSRRLDPAEAGGREIAGRVSKGIRRKRKRGEGYRRREQLLHRASLLATGDQSTEKCGLSSSARRSQ